jgi:dipeptidyl aminopeptidase/acylaminoacyl peptidase
VTPSGYTEVLQGRSKGGEPPDEYRFGIVRIDPATDPDSVRIRWVELPEAGGESTIIHGPYWSVEGDRAVIQVLSRDHEHRWIARLDPTTGGTEVVDHQHDEAWIGGPPPIGERLRPGLLEWIPGGRFIFASERTGWSHLYLAEPDGTVRALTGGEWEVRGARLSRDRTRWLVTASREHPADDHLYLMPAAGGELTRLTSAPGRHFGFLSPDGRRMAVVHGASVRLPDLFLAEAREGAEGDWVRVTVSGTDNYYRHRWVQPEMVTFPDKDGRPLWAALFKPEQPNPERAAVIHVHGGGYRQFAHRGWSVYGYDMHVGMINYLVQQGYTVLDFDYKGSAGYGRDYRTDVYRSMGITDVDGAVTAVDWLVREHDIDPDRVGIYGISMGGFFTLMALFRYPGVFAAGAAIAAPTSWEDDSTWPVPILNLPYEDPEAYRMASPIYYSHRLEDPLLIAHGFLDDNVHVHDAIRLVQRLLEHDKEFEVMYYPVEEHGFATEESRYDFNRRLTTFFQRHLLGRWPGAGR